MNWSLCPLAFLVFDFHRPFYSQTCDDIQKECVEEIGVNVLFFSKAALDKLHSSRITLFREKRYSEHFVSVTNKRLSVDCYSLT